MKGRQAVAATPAHGTFALRDRTQLTTTGNVWASAISGDGKQLAYITHNCAEAGCSYAVEIQDVGGTATHRILEGASAAYGLEWSPDRRNLIFEGTVSGRYGMYLLSALGGGTRYLSPAGAAFWAGGDSLLVGPPATGNDSVFQVRVTSIDGAVRDSIAVHGPGLGVAALSVQPGGKWIVALVVQSRRGLWQVFDRSGKVADRVLNSCTCGGRITSDALWLTRAGQGFESIVRVGLDPATGHLSTRQDTLLSGAFNNFSVTANGSTLVLDDGTSSYNLYALSLGDAFAGKLPNASRRLESSTRINGKISPDGRRLMIARNLPSANGATERRFSIMPFDGGAEAQIATRSDAREAGWVDSTTLLVGGQSASGMHAALVDVHTGAVQRSLDLPDSLIVDLVPLPDGWAWIPATADRIIIQRGGNRLEIPKPTSMAFLQGVRVDRAGQRFVGVGWNSQGDSIRVAVVPVTGGPWAIWMSAPAEQGVARFADDGSVVFVRSDTPESVVLYRLTAPDKPETLGRVRMSVLSATVSGDLKRMALLAASYRGDAFMSKVVETGR